MLEQSIFQEAMVMTEFDCMDGAMLVQKDKGTSGAEEEANAIGKLVIGHMVVMVAFDGSK